MKLVWIVAAILAVVALIWLVRAFMNTNWTKRFEETSHPSACIDCNKGSCRGCALEFLTKEQANEVATQLTQQAIADSSVVYTKRFDRKEVR